MKIKNKVMLIVSISLVPLLITLGLIWSRDALAWDDSLSQHLSPGFTYQGYLDVGGKPAEGEFNFSFEMFSAEMDGDSLGYIEVESVKISGGYFTVLLEFDSEVFAGEDRWLEIGVDSEGGGEYLILDGRQKLTPVPYAFYANQAGGVDWWDISSRPTGLDNGDQDTTYSAGFGLELDGTTFNARTDTLQTRVTGECGYWNVVRKINQDGSVECWLDSKNTRDWQPIGNYSTTLDSDGNVGYGNSITIGIDGMPIISYIDYTNHYVKVAHCNNIFCTEAIIHTIDDVGMSGNSTSIAIGVDGLPVISYSDMLNDKLILAHCDDFSCTSAYTSTVDSIQGWSSSLTIGSDGFPAISYYDSDDSDLEFAHCEDIFCTNVTTTTLDSATNTGDFSSLTIDSFGNPNISYYENGTLFLILCADPSCSSFGGKPVGYTTNNEGKFTSITLGTDGLPIISYIDDTNDDLKVAHCIDVSCSSEDVQVLGSPSTLVSGGTSITIGSDGLPNISYYDSTNQRLMFAHCHDMSCATGSTYSILDSSYNVGTRSSITIGIDGFPIISYRDELNDDLKVIKCGNSLCIPNWRRR